MPVRSVSRRTVKLLVFPNELTHRGNSNYTRRNGTGTRYRVYPTELLHFYIPSGANDLGREQYSYG